MIRILSRKGCYSDVEVVEGLQARNGTVERWFYESAQRYFERAFKELFFDDDNRQEIFQTAFIKLWTEIENKRIRVVDGKVCRQQGNGRYEPMTCSLNTFLIAFARTEFREQLRNVRDEYYEELYENINEPFCCHENEPGEVDNEELKNRIVDECIASLPSNCVEILTLFYYKNKSLDEIMELRDGKNESKNGLKSAKNKCMVTLRERVMNMYRMCNL